MVRRARRVTGILVEVVVFCWRWCFVVVDTRLVLEHMIATVL